MPSPLTPARRRAPLALALTLGLLLSLGLAPARAVTLTVTNTSDSGPGSLRAAIATANTDGGDDTINFSLPPGTYPQITLSSTLTITAPMTISGPNGVAYYPILDGGHTGSVSGVQVFSISGGTTVEPVALANLVIADGNASTSIRAGVGGGIYSAPGDVLTLTSCIVTDNTVSAANAADYGGGVYNDGNLTLTACTLSGNSAPGGEGGGLYNHHGSTATLTNCTLSGNSADNGGEGGGLMNDEGTATLTGCTLTNNSAQYGGYESPFYGAGGGLCDIGGTATLTRCTLSGNSAANGGGIDHIGGYGGTINLTNCTLTRNSAAFGGAVVTGAAGNTFGTDNLTNCTLTGNSATSSAGGIFVNGYLTLDNDILYGDTAPVNNEVDPAPNAPITAVYCDIGQSSPFTGSSGNIDADPNFVNAPYDVTLKAGSPCIGHGDPAQAGTRDINGVIRFNPPTIGANEGYPLVVTNANASGAGSLSGVLLTARSAPDAVITFDPYFFTYFNTITPAATLELAQSVEIIGPAAGVAVSGGSSHGIFQVDSGVQAILTGLTMTNGSVSGGFGGGLYNSGGAVTVTGCTLSGNSALEGGGLYNAGTATLTGCTLSGSSASSDGGGIATGGSVNDTLTLTDCTLSGNTAALQGGALAEIGLGTVTVTDCTLSGNSAHGGTGGGILTFAGTLTVTDCSFTGNSASTLGGAISNQGGTATLDNDILYGDTATTSNEISGSVSATYCDINQSGYTDTGDIRADPMFVGPPGNLQLPPNSPCIGQGDPAQAGTYDIIGTLRPNPPSIGAYEGLPAATRTHLVGSSGSSIYGQSVTFTATVENNSPGSRSFPTGSVEFYVNGIPAATVSLTKVNGVATAVYTTSGLPGGSDVVSATFLANAQFDSSLSGPLRHDVGPAKTSTGVSSFLNPSTVGEQVDFVATVTNTSPGTSAVPTGSVAFYLNGSTTPFDTETLDQSGQAGTLYTFTKPGAYTITAKYLGGSDFSGSTGSLSPSEQVNLNTPTVYVSASPSPSVYGQSVTFSVTVFGSDSSVPIPTGTVTLQGLPGSPVVTLSDSGQGSSVGSYTTSALPVGPNNYSAAYSGDGAYASQTVTGLSQTVNPGPAAKLTLAAPANATAGQPFQATVTETDAYGNPVTSAATVSFSSTDPRAVLPTPVSLTNGAATVTVTDYTGGQQTLTASAGGLTSATAATTVAQATVQAVSVGWGGRTAPVPAGRDLPWLGISRIVLTLSAAETVAPGDVSVTGIKVANYGPVSVSGSGTTTVTLTLAQPISAADRVTVKVGNASIAAYSAPLAVLPGDINGDGAVNAQDMVLARNALSAAYNVLADINGDGVVDMTDYNLVRARVGTRLP